ncbi:MAG TPA: hypothetical protein VHM91_17345 [Verrucomicrobiales bacterium]|nr:hypothetical protein [Verrucomicrobiales bacterium]
MNTRNTFLAASLAVSALLSRSANAQASPYRGLWVGEIRLGAVNEVSVPLDANNIPRAPNPAVPTKTFDTANLRLILHVNGAGQVSLLKQVAILNRKAGALKSENDAALVTDERLYGSFPPQPAQRIASVVFDFGDMKATAAVDAVVEAAAAAAAAKINSGGSSSAANTDARNAAQAVINAADAAARFSVFLRDVATTAAVAAAANTGAFTPAQGTAAANLRDTSFYKDTRGVDMLQSVLAAVSALPAGSTAAQKNKAAQNAAAAFADVANSYQRFVAGELFGDMTGAAAEAAATAAAALPVKSVTAYGGTANTAPLTITTANHLLSTSDKIRITGAPIASYNGTFTVTRLSADTFSLPGVKYIAGKTISGYAAATKLSPLTILSPGHGLTSGTRITITGAGTAGYNGSFYVTVTDADSFTIPVAFDDDPATRGVWASHSGAITGYEAAPAGGSGVKITSPGHGLNNGDVIFIEGSGASVYNGSRTITRVDADSFTIPVAFGGNPAAKGTWSVRNEIAGFSAPAEKLTTVTSTAHGLSTGDRVVITGSGFVPYNATHTVEKVDDNTFIIPVVFPASGGDPATKGAWAPELSGTWKPLASIVAAVDGSARVNDAKTEALRIKMTAYDDTRGSDAIAAVLAAVEAAAADSRATSKGEIQPVADAAGRTAQADLVARSNIPSLTPTPDYTAFITASDSRFTDFGEIAPIVAAAAAQGASTEVANILHTADSVKNKAKEAILAAIPSVYATAARALRPELRMEGKFGPGETGLTGTITLPANHPTNPFRHRRHPDHSTGFDITRVITLGFDGAAGDTLSVAGYGVDGITGTYDEEIFGLHKPLGPAKDTGLKVRGTFSLKRISLIDALNAR